MDPYLSFNPMGEEDLRWYLEDYAPKYPYDLRRAESIEHDLVRYGQVLVGQLRALPIAMLSLVVRIS
jgi:hypothetical protein